jgi:hypothetical protein
MFRPDVHGRTVVARMPLALARPDQRASARRDRRIASHASVIEVCEDMRGGRDRPSETVQPRDHQGGELACGGVSEQSCQLRAIAGPVAVAASDIKVEVEGARQAACCCCSYAWGVGRAAYV